MHLSRPAFFLFFSLISLSLWSQSKTKMHYTSIQAPFDIEKQKIYINEQKNAIAIHDIKSDSAVVFSFVDGQLGMTPVDGNGLKTRQGYKDLVYLDRSCQAHDIASKKVVALTAKRKKNTVYCSSLNGLTQDYITISEKESNRQGDYELGIWLEQNKEYSRITKGSIKGDPKKLSISTFRYNNLPVIIILSKLKDGRDFFTILYN